MAPKSEVSTEFSKGISPDLKQSFEKNGFLHFRNFLDIHAVEAIRTAINELSRSWVQQDLKVLNGTPIKFGRDVDGTRIAIPPCTRGIDERSSIEFASEPLR